MPMKPVRVREKAATTIIPLQRGADWAVWSRALESACDVIAAFELDALVVSLGVDTFKNDPLSHFRLESDD